MDFTGRRIAVTGAAGGLGGAIARALAADGATVLGMDLPTAWGGRDASPSVIPVGMDVGDPASVEHGFAAIDPAALDALVVAAGVQLHGQDGPAADVEMEVWNTTISVNLTGAFLTLKYALPLLSTAARSSVVLIGSPTGLTMSGAGYTAYAASKAGMMSMARIVAADYARHGVRANVVVPGTMRTPLIEPLLSDPAKHQALLDASPIGRLGEPADVVGVVRWLVSDESSFATGGFYAVDGGLTAR
jgi:NAD(P)-dependent dehydrogenase (short-subunit alcohol dehydrogenase family)